MKKKLLSIVLLAVAAPVFWLGSSQSPNWSDQNQGLGGKLAGGWLANLNLGTISAEVLFNLTADGCMVINGQLRNFNDGTSMNTTAHGTWKRIGPDMIEAHALLFIHAGQWPARAHAPRACCSCRGLFGLVGYR